jgi:biopolymer transport protein ExbB
MEGLKELVDYGIIGLLTALSIWAVAVALERWIYFRRVDATANRNSRSR